MATGNNLDAGDGDRYRGQTISLDSASNTVNDGDAVKFDGSGDITQTTANGDNYIGVVLPEDKSGSDDDNIRTVHVSGNIVAVQLDSTASVGAGDTLVPSDEDNGAWESDPNSEGMTVDTSSGNTGFVNHPFALESGGNDEVILACFR